MEKLAINGGKPVRTKPFPAQYIGANLIGKEEKALVNKVIDAKSLFRHYGANCLNMTGQFEKELSAFIGTRYALAVSSGSGALFCAMKGLNVGAGDEVILPALGWISDYNAIAFSWATPVFADIDSSLNMNPESFKSKITKKTKAVIVIHYQGAASRLDEIVKIAHSHKIKVIEDVAQAIGGAYDGKKLGSLGDVAIFSFQNNKVITTGDGGALVTDDQEIFERATRFHDLGMLRTVFEKNLEKKRMTEPFLGSQWRMNELTGAVALAQLRKLPDIVRKTRTKSAKLRAILKKELPRLKFRDVKPENDIGILVSIDLGSKTAAAKFKDAYQAEGLVYGATSGCGVFNTYAAILADMKNKNIYKEKDFEAADGIIGSMAPIAVLPVYNDKDIKDIAKGIIKVVKGIS
jgi:8-amino-3,8-dideoxy-alpha-D-manno-octulosonate transaminase